MSRREPVRERQETDVSEVEKRLRQLERHNAVLTAVVQGMLNDARNVQDRLQSLERRSKAHGKQLAKVRASVKEDPCTELDDYDRASGWTDLNRRVQELELEVHAESLSRLDRLSKMSTRQLQEADEVSRREAWAVLLRRNFDGWSREVQVGDVWFVRDGMKGCSTTISTWMLRERRRSRRRLCTVPVTN